MTSHNANTLRTLKELYDDYRPAIVRITIRTREGDLANGCGFHIGHGNIVTAKHVLDDGELDAVTRVYDDEPVHVRKVLDSSEPGIDLALLQTDFDLSDYVNKTHFLGDKRRQDAKTDRIPLSFFTNEFLGAGFVLTKVLLMGFPRVPRSNKTYLLAVTGEVNALIGKYREEQPHFIISTVARGGFSGGPVINEYGSLLAVLIESLYEQDQAEENGFASAIAIEPLLNLLAEHGIEPIDIPPHLWKDFCQRIKTGKAINNTRTGTDD